MNSGVKEVGARGGAHMQRGRGGLAATRRPMDRSVRRTEQVGGAIVEEVLGRVAHAVDAAVALKVLGHGRFHRANGRRTSSGPPPAPAPNGLARLRVDLDTVDARVGEIAVDSVEELPLRPDLSCPQPLSAAASHAS